MRILQLVFAVGELNTERFGKAVAEIVAGTALQRFAVVHHRFDGVGGFGTGEFFFIGFAALDHRDRQRLLTEISIYIQHPLGFFHRVLGGFVHGVTFLPVKLHRAQEGAGGFFPPHHRAPLVVQLGQVAIRMDDLGVVVAKHRFGCRAHAQPLGQLLLAAVGDPRHFGSKAFHMVFFALQQAFRNKKRHHDVFMPQRLEPRVQIVADILPQRRRVRAHDHAAAHAAIRRQLGFFDHIGIPLGKILVHRGDGFYHLFVFVAHNLRSRLSCWFTDLFILPLNKRHFNRLLQFFIRRRQNFRLFSIDTASEIVHSKKGR